MSDENPQQVIPAEPQQSDQKPKPYQQTSGNSNQKSKGGSNSLIIKIIKNILIFVVTFVAGVYIVFDHLLQSVLPNSKDRGLHDYEISLPTSELQSTGEVFSTLLSVTNSQFWFVVYIMIPIISIVLLFLSTNKLSKILFLNSFRILLLLLVITSFPLVAHRYYTLNSDSKVFYSLLSDTQYPNLDQITLKSRTHGIFERNIIVKFETTDSIEKALAFYKESIGGDNKIENPEAKIEEREYSTGTGSSFSAQLRIDTLGTSRRSDFKINFFYDPSSNKSSGTVITITD